MKCVFAYLIRVYFFRGSLFLPIHGNRYIDSDIARLGQPRVVHLPTILGNVGLIPITGQKENEVAGSCWFVLVSRL